MKKRAVVLVPGLQRQERFAAREKLVQAIVGYASGYRMNCIELDEKSQRDACGIVACDRETQESIELHVYEAFWGDLVPDWSKESPWARFRRGLHLIWYWAAGGVARALLRLEFPARTVLAMMVASLLLLLWYFTVISVLVQTLNTADSAVPTAIQEALDHFGWSEALVNWIDQLQSLPLILFLIMLFGLGRLENLANISSFIKDYLRDQQFNDQEIGVRAKSRARVVALLDHVHGEDRYDEVHVVGHSLGGAIAVDALAGYGKPLPHTTLHTWGAGLGLLVQQDAWIERRIEALYSSTSRLAQWHDVVFPSDVLASPRPLPRVYDGEKRKSEVHREIYARTVRPQAQSRAPFQYIDTHESYFRCTDAVRLLVGPGDPAGQIEATPAAGEADPASQPASAVPEIADFVSRSAGKGAR